MSNQPIPPKPMVRLPLPGIENVIAVSSGKGGVGKSTVAVNLAFSLCLQGHKVGLLDADIYGPNQPLLLNKQQKPTVNEANKMRPVEVQGLATQSLGYLIDSNAPMVWRGPMVSKALHQLLYDTAWGTLDYLIIDCPPGTGDVQLTLAQRVPLTGAVVVTTPQTLAVADTAKSIAMFNKVQIPVLGVIENMSYVSCGSCHHKDYVFGQGGGQRLAEQFAIPLLAQLPLVSTENEQAAAKPFVLQYPDHPLTKQFQSIALTLAGHAVS